MNICLINPVITVSDTYDHACNIGLAYIKAVLKQNDFDVDVIDAPVCGLSNKDIFNLLKEKKYQAIGISCYYYNYESAYRIIRHIRHNYSHVFTFIGGYLPTLTYERIRDDFHLIDCAVIGEGEMTTLKLMESVDQHKEWKHIKGIAYKEQDEIVFTDKCDLIENLDLLPYPEYIYNHENPKIYLSLSRGCYGNCTFCGIREFYSSCEGKYPRRRSPENAVGEIESVINTYHPKCIEFVDDDFSIGSKKGKEWFYGFTEIIKQKKINIKFSCSMRADEVTNNQKLLEDFISIGLNDVFIGIESFLDKHLKFYNKMATVDQNIKALRILDELNINYRIGYLLFNPITTLEDIFETINIIKKINLNHKNKNMINELSSATVSIMRGTPLFSYIEQNHLINNSFKGYKINDDRAELCCEVAGIWYRKIQYLHSIYYDNKKNINDDTIYTNECRKIFYDLYMYDLNVLEMIATLINEGKNTIGEFSDHIAEWGKELFDFEKKLEDIKLSLT